MTRGPADTDKDWLLHKSWLGVTRWQWVIASYVFIIVMYAAGLFLQARLADQVRQVAVQRAEAICEVTNDNREVSNERLRQVLVFVFDPPPYNEREQEILDYVDSTLLPPTDCKNPPPLKGN